MAWAKAHGELRLVRALDEVEGQRLERIGGGAEWIECGEGVLDELVGVLTRALEAEDSGPGGFIGGRVFACGLAELLGGLRYVEHVIDDLEGEPGLFTEGAQARDDIGRSAG